MVLGHLVLEFRQEIEFDYICLNSRTSMGGFSQIPPITAYVLFNPALGVRLVAAKTSQISDMGGSN